ncbi:MAG: cobalamin-dependent protein [Alphaproteobacteria bacterium]|mgnify:CR=1 FL=1|nr:cobalamin-dependent protein [Alphaproteobacteria bacterium]
MPLVADRVFDKGSHTSMNIPPATDRPAKVLITKIGLDGHDRGSRLIAIYLRDAGMEVIYTGPWQEIAAVVAMASQEDVDVIGISSLATDHLIVPKLMTALENAGLGDVPVVIGGIVPDEEEKMLYAAGVAQVFHPGAGREEIVDRIGALATAAHEAG